jgi:acyl-[acyl carrier protein]--UDP-N-acetylglucosamine O-acyltransferase
LREMWLSEAAKFGMLDLHRDGKFRELGLLSSRGERVLAPLLERKFLSQLLNHRGIAAVITTTELVQAIPAQLAVATVRECSPKEALYRIHLELIRRGFYGRLPKSEIAPGVKIHPRAYVESEGVQIGSNTTIDANAVIKGPSIVGENVVLGPGVVIGGDGYEPQDVCGRRTIIAHVGGVRLGNCVHIQANSAISKSLFGGFTEVGDDTTMDNLVHVAHNVCVGKRCRLAACAMIAGSTVIGNDVWLGPQVSISSGLVIGDRARITIGAVVTKDVSVDGHVSGNFAIAHGKFVEFIRTIR